MKFIKFCRKRVSLTRSILFLIFITSISLVYRAANVDLVKKIRSINLDNSVFHMDFFSWLTKNGVQLVLLVAHEFTANTNTTIENDPISLGIFEKDREMFRRLYSENSPQGWSLIELSGKDYRLMRPTKAASIQAEVITHFFLVSATSIIHIPIVFPRSNFYWIAGIDGLPAKYQHLARLNFSIPLPMAVETFGCTEFLIFSSIPICIPDDLDFYFWQLQHARFFECHYEDIVFPFKNQYNVTELTDPKIQIETVGEVLRVAKEVRVPAILLGGSLLGWYRQCNQIVKSLDADLGILSEDYKPALFDQLFKNKVIRLCCRYGSRELGLEYRMYPWTMTTIDYWLDMFLMYPTSDPNKFLAYLWDKRTGILWSCTYPKRRGVCSAELFGLLVFIPCNYVEFVEGDFGKNGWFSPKDGYPYTSIKKFASYKEDEFAAFMHVTISPICLHKTRSHVGMRFDTAECHRLAFLSKFDRNEREYILIYEICATVMCQLLIMGKKRIA